MGNQNLVLDEKFAPELSKIISWHLILMNHDRTGCSMISVRWRKGKPSKGGAEAFFAPKLSQILSWVLNKNLKNLTHCLSFEQNFNVAQYAYRCSLLSVGGKTNPQPSQLFPSFYLLQQRLGLCYHNNHHISTYHWAFWVPIDLLLPLPSLLSCPTVWVIGA